MSTWREKSRDIRTRLFMEGLQVTCSRLEEAGWGHPVRSEGSQGFAFRGKAFPLISLAEIGQKVGVLLDKEEHWLQDHAFGMARLSLMLDFMALDAPMAVVMTVMARGREATRWAAHLVADIARRRYEPPWWAKDREWHAKLIDHGYTPAMLEDPELAWRGMVELAQGLAIGGWMDLQVFQGAAFTGENELILSCWGKGASEIAAMLKAAALTDKSLPDEATAHVLAVGRFALLLELWMWHAPGELAGEILRLGQPVNLWVARLAELLSLKRWRPKWIDKAPGWHNVIRDRVLVGVRQWKEELERDNVPPRAEG